jgi:hypothetical protein
MLLPSLKYNLGITMLGHIILDMIRAGANKNGKGLVIGFMAELSRELSSTILKCITFILRRPTSKSADGWRQHRAVHYAAHARANARTCSPGEDPFTDVTSSPVCLPSSSSTNESSQRVSVPLVRTILTMFCSCTSFSSKRGWRRASCSSVQDARRV